jgi:hypothetical protein
VFGFSSVFSPAQRLGLGSVLPFILAAGAGLGTVFASSCRIHFWRGSQSQSFSREPPILQPGQPPPVPFSPAGAGSRSIPVWLELHRAESNQFVEQPDSTLCLAPQFPGGSFSLYARDSTAASL